MTYQVKRIPNEPHQSLKRRIRAESQKLYKSEAWLKMWAKMWADYRKKNK